MISARMARGSWIAIDTNGGKVFATPDEEKNCVAKNPSATIRLMARGESLQKTSGAKNSQASL